MCHPQDVVGSPDVHRAGPTTAAGGPRKVIIRPIRGVNVPGVLTIELKAINGEPILCGVEAVAE
jgi:hypothetical protein